MFFMIWRKTIEFMNQNPHIQNDSNLLTGHSREGPRFASSMICVYCNNPCVYACLLLASATLSVVECSCEVECGLVVSNTGVKNRFRKTVEMKIPVHIAEEIMKIGFLGGGRLAFALANGFISAGLAKAEEITASVHPADVASAEAFKGIGATCLTENVPVVERSEVVVISVKPGVVPLVLSDVARSPAAADKLFISVAMGVTIAAIEKSLPSSARVVRVMPNTPALVRHGAAAYSLGARAGDADARLTERLFRSVGTCEQVPESSMDAVTALSGSGPAYVYMMIEALAEGGVRSGLMRDLALRLAAQTVLGSAAMVQQCGHPAELKDNVTSPAGSTAEGTYVLEKSGFRAALIGAVTAATERCKVVSEQMK